MQDGIVWSFQTENFAVSLIIEEESYPKYDGDDEDGEVQRKLDNGEYVMFESRVEVAFKDGCSPTIVGTDYLGGSVYANGEENQFWTAHRDPDPMNRNCSIMRATRGGNVTICHYFPDMVRIAIKAARERFNKMPRLRAVTY